MVSNGRRVAQLNWAGAPHYGFTMVCYCLHKKLEGIGQKVSEVLRKGQINSTTTGRGKWLYTRVSWLSIEIRKRKVINVFLDFSK